MPTKSFRLVGIAVLALALLGVDTVQRRDAVVRALNSQNWEQAQAQLDSWRGQEDNPADIAKYQGFLYLLSGGKNNNTEQYLQGVQQLKSYLEQRPSDWEAVELLLRAYQNLNRSAEGLPTVEKYLRHHPDHDAALLLFANMQLRANQGQRALAPLQRLAQIAPTTPGLWGALTKVYQEQGKAEKARQAAWSGVRYQPMEQTAWFNIANQLSAAQQYNRALLVMDILVRMNPELLQDPAYFSTLAASEGQGFLIAGTLLGQTRLNDQTTKQLNAPPQLKTVLGWEKQQRMKMLNAHLTRWLESQPRSPWAQALLGYQLIQTQQYTEARTALEKALQLNDRLELAWLMAWQLYQITDDARGQLSVARAMNEMQPDQLVWQFRYAHALYRNGQYVASIAVAREGLKGFAEQPFAHIELVDALLQLGRRRDAVSAYLDAETAMSGLPGPLFQFIALPEVAVKP